MNNVFVYCELEGTVVAEVSLELLTKGRKLANQLGCQLEAVVAGTNLAGIENKYCPSALTVFTSSTLRACSLILHCPTLPYLSICSRKKNRRSV